ncbi:MAG: inositol monophosphatase family protein [Phycisphaerales bacterium]
MAAVPSPAPQSPLLSPLLAAAREAVCAAAAVTRAVQQTLRRDQTLSKDDQSPVTIADFAAQAVVIDRLRRHLGTLRVVGEESSAFLRDPARFGVSVAALEAARVSWPEATRDDFLDTIDFGSASADSPFSPVPSAQCPVPSSFWTLDPIDGTKGFIRGHQYSVCLALVENGRVLLAALACPNLSADFDRPFEDPDPRGTVYLATETGPVLWHAADDAAAVTQVLVPRRREPGTPLRLIGSFAASHQNESTSAAIRRRLGARGVALAEHRKIDSQCKYAVVARGQADVFLRTPRPGGGSDCIWDHAPGSLIAGRAGCIVSDTLGTPLDFARGDTLSGNSGILVGRPADHALVVAESRAVISAA